MVHLNVCESKLRKYFVTVMLTFTTVSQMQQLKPIKSLDFYGTIQLSNGTIPNGLQPTKIL